MRFARHALHLVGPQPEHAPDEPLDHSRAGILPEGHRCPSAPGRFGGKCAVRIDGDRAADALEKRQVVVRIAVENTLSEIGETRSLGLEPFIQALHLSLPEARRAAYAPGEALALH